MPDPLRRTSALILAALTGLGSAACTPAASLSVERGGLAAVEAAIANQKGHGCLVNFWATWCPPCVEELPDLVEVARAFEGRGGRVIGVSHDLLFPKSTEVEVPGQVRAFLEEHEYHLPTVVLDPDEVDAVDARYELPGYIPVTLAFDREGKLVDREDGPATKERFEELMRAALATSPQ